MTERRETDKEKRDEWGKRETSGGKKRGEIVVEVETIFCV